MACFWFSLGCPKTINHLAGLGNGANVRKGVAVVRTGTGEIITMQPHLDALETFLGVKGLRRHT